MQALGISLPTPSYLIGTLLFGIIGWIAYRHGRRQGQPRIRWIGLALMLYPYVMPQTWLLYVVGVALCVGLYVCNKV